jgi:Protein of unknown function (DUF3352)
MTVKRVLVALVVATALVATGCGSKSSSTGGSLDTALGYVPKNAPLVIAIDTNSNGGQWKQVDQLLGRFPFGGQVKQQLKNAFNARANVDYDKDVKPLLGNDMVLAITAVAQQPNVQTPYVFAWKLKDESAARKLIQATTQKSGTLDGLDVYGAPPTNFAVIKDSTLVIADTMPSLKAALDRPKGDHMSASDFQGALNGLNSDSLLRMTGNFQQLLTGKQALVARKIKWLSALSTFGLTLRAEPDGIAYDFKAKTDSSGLTSKDLPLASGTASPPVVKRAGEVAFGVRGPAQIVSFAQQAAQITNPKGYGKYLRDKVKLSKQLGVDVDRDLIGQLTGNATVSISVDGGVAVKADVRDPATAAATLTKVAPRLPKLARGRGKTETLSSSGPLYTLTQPNGKKVVFGVIGKSFVVASDAARAVQIAGQSPSPVAGAKGSLVFFSDARALANAVAAKRGQGVAAQVITSALGDFSGYVDSETNGITGHLELQIK